MKFLQKRKLSFILFAQSLFVALMPTAAFAANGVASGFSGVIAGINSFCSSATPLIGALLVLELIFMGISAVINKGDGKMKLKEDMKWVIIGTAIGLCASSLGTEITSWFM